MKKSSVSLDQTCTSCPLGSGEKKNRNSFVQNAQNCQGDIEEKNVSELFGQTAHFPPVGSGRKKIPIL